ncbi:hypothetical protein FB451DRAFT_1413255 [Mycena latifolia]|nr:hypothetical protein FB451DRAFT_1413255 [Mycena latifolia]
MSDDRTLTANGNSALSVGMFACIQAASLESYTEFPSVVAIHGFQSSTSHETAIAIAIAPHHTPLTIRRSCYKAVARRNHLPTPARQLTAIIVIVYAVCACPGVAAVPTKRDAFSDLESRCTNNPCVHIGGLHSGQYNGTWVYDPYSADKGAEKCDAVFLKPPNVNPCGIDFSFYGQPGSYTLEGCGGQISVNWNGMEAAKCQAYPHEALQIDDECGFVPGYLCG